MDAPRQVRISVNGVLQFTAKVSQSEDLNDVAARAAETMRLGHLTAHVSPGQINFLPASTLRLKHRSNGLVLRATCRSRLTA